MRLDNSPVDVDEFFDEEGYPTTHAFDLIEKWDFHHTDKLFEFIRQLWCWNDTHWVQKDDGEKIIYDISTGGWSGNEYLLSVLERNLMVWEQTWVQTRRGGHYIFELPYKKQPFMIGNESEYALRDRETTDKMLDALKRGEA